jgi:molecular chaperone GrpE
MKDPTRDDSEKEAAEAEEDVVMVDAPSETLEEILAEEEAAARQEKTAAKKIHASLAKAERELEEMRDRHLRKLAEFENFKKRTEKEKADYFKYALVDIVREILPVLDNFERALAHRGEGGEADEYHQGISLIYLQLSEILRRRGLSEVPTDGAFDPNLHEAVARQETGEAPPNAILDVLQKGYFLNDRLLRPAFVKVAVPPGEGSSESS